MNALAKLFLIINGIILITYGLVFLINPTILGRLVGFTYNNSNAMIEVMAFYGGLKIGIGCFFIWCAFDDNRHKMALAAFTIIFLATGIARGIGYLQFGDEDPIQLIISGIELSFCLFAFCLHTIVPFFQKKAAYNSSVY
ncbi:MAG: DUF4345 domain-containing protein [Bacteroidota bacterium]